MSILGYLVQPFVMASQQETVPVEIPDDDMETRGLGAGVASPASRKRGPPETASGPGPGITLEVLQGVLATQTRELRDAQKLELARAMGKVQLDIRKEFEGVRHEMEKVAGKVEEQGARLSRVESQQDGILKRLQALETGGSTRAGGSSEASRDEPRLGLIVGGWNRMTKKDDALGQMEALMTKLDCRAQLDGEWFTTGLRRGYVLCNGEARLGERPEAARARLQKVAAAIQAAKQVPYGEDPATPYLWAGMQKSRGDRDRSAHLGKIRKLLHQKAPSSLDQVDWEYRTGTAYYQTRVIASVSLPVPADRVTTPGKLPGSWVDVGSLSQLIEEGVQDTKTLLRALYDN